MFQLRHVALGVATYRISRHFALALRHLAGDNCDKLR